MLSRDLLNTIRDRATARDVTGDWPADELAMLDREAGACRWAIASADGGEGLSPLDVHLRYEQIAAASLAVALILSQRDSAVGFLDGSDSFAQRGPLLRQIATNELFGTIGIAQLTTSRQGGVPALRATRVDGGYQLDGLVPWSTGAAHAAFIVAGAVLPDRQQILFLLRPAAAGVTIDPPMPLVAMRATWTTAVRCDAAVLPDADVIRGPAASALAGGHRSVPLGQAFLATGLCRGAIDLIEQFQSHAATQAAGRFEEELELRRRDVLAYVAADEPDHAAGPSLRARCNDLAVRVTHAAVAFYKGSALLPDHPAQRLAREAMFLLVWSCPTPVVECTVELLAVAKPDRTAGN